MESTVVIVDDDKDLLHVYKGAMRSLGNTFCFSSPKEFLNHMRDNPQFKPDLVITDFSMPGMDGLQMLVQAHAFCGSAFPSILISGYLDKGIAIRANNVGVCRILEKPASRSEILNVAHEILTEKEVEKIRTEFREVAEQLRELFAVFRIVCEDEIETSTISQPDMVTGPDGEGMSLEEALDQLEQRLEHLDRTELGLKELREKLNRRTKAAA